MLQQTLRQLDRAFTDMWRRGFGFPRFKKRLRSFVFPQFKECPLQGNRIKLPKLGWVRLRLLRPVPEPFAIKQVRLIRKASGYYINLSLQAEVDVPEP